ncbi:hypothetical protein C8F04DRAFT_403602 [Mycena alexandri]|uniref:Uncharacterized protein n=1 Tax=Mycena alexandri TaxID=1745969 RepID=A0AAD6T1H4_9AGAR|nr:hypothetical protein C8F04DRAFT_403602 [Mycena alexandri]
MVIPPAPAPSLPLELERTIFELSAIDTRMSIPNLMLVAWRVRNWVEPLLYQIMFISTPRVGPQIHGFPVFTPNMLFRIIECKSSRLVHVRYLYINGLPGDTVTTILAACPLLIGLFGFAGGDVPCLAALGALKALSRLAANLEQVFPFGKIDFTHGLFRTLTHLELLDAVDLHIIRNITLIPHLTHIAFHRPPHTQHAYNILVANIGLQCILFFHVADLKVHLRLEDIRCVCVVMIDYTRDWLLGADGGEDYWTVANSFIAAKRAGRIDHHHFPLLYASPDIL